MKKGNVVCGPSIDIGVEYVVVPANRKAIDRLIATLDIAPVPAESVKMLSPEQFIGKAAGERYLSDNSAKWSGKFCPFVTIRDIDALATPKVKELKKKIKAEEKSLADTLARTDVGNFKARLVTCEQCESKINREYIKESMCPVCGHDMRSKTALQSVESKNNRIKRYRDKLTMECIKHADEAPLRYLVVVPKKEA